MGVSGYSRATLHLPERIATRRLILRPVDVADHDCHWRMDRDVEVMRYVGPAEMDFHHHRERFMSAIADGQRFRFLRSIEQTGCAGAIGWVFLRPTEDGQWLELGYRLLPEAWGQGYVPEASRPLIRHAFEAWGASAVMALIMPGNHQSRRVAEKLGFTSRGQTEAFYDETLELWVLDADE